MFLQKLQTESLEHFLVAHLQLTQTHTHTQHWSGTGDSSWELKMPSFFFFPSKSNIPIKHTWTEAHQWWSQLDPCLWINQEAGRTRRQADLYRRVRSNRHGYTNKQQEAVPCPLWILKVLWWDQKGTGCCDRRYQKTVGSDWNVRSSHQRDEVFLLVCNSYEWLHLSLRSFY